MNVSTQNRIPRWGMLGALAGLIGGAGMGLYAMATSAMLGRSIWQPINAVAATLPNLRPAPTGLAPTWLVVGTLLHFLVAALLGVGYAAYVHFESTRQNTNFAPSWYYSALFGPAWGLGTWLVMGLLIAPRISPVFATADQIQYLAGHLVYGMVVGYAYTALARRKHLRVTFAPGVPVQREELAERS